MRRLAAHLAALAAALWIASAALAQDEIDFERWEETAAQIEQSLGQSQQTIESLDAFRATVADWRERLEAGTGANAERIATIQTQIDALGPPPAEGESESTEAAARRDELNEALSEARAPRIDAETALARANTLISQIDRHIRDLQTDAFFKLQRSPLLPDVWRDTVERVGETISDIRAEVRENTAQFREEGALAERLPLAGLLLAAALLLIVRGPRHVERLVQRVEERASEQGQIVFGFLVSLGAILLPLAGISLINAAVISTGVVGEVGRAAALGINVGIIAFSISRWLGSRMFPEGVAQATPLSLDESARRRGRFLSRSAGFLLGLLLVIRVIDNVENFDGVLIAALAFPIFIVLGVTLYFLGALIRSGRTAGDASGYGDFLLSVSGRALQLVGVVAPILAAIGYYNMARGVLAPITVTLALFAFLTSLHYVIRAAYGLVRGLSKTESENALMPVLISFALVIASTPLLALIWGARVTDLSEAWTRFRAGIRIGEATISPGDFLTVLIVFAIGMAATRVVQGLMRTSVLPRTRLDKGGRNAVVSGLGYVGVTLAALAGVTAAGIDLSAFALVVGALGVGIGFGLQNIVNNFVSGIILLIERPIGEGDWVDVNGNFGVVKSISVRSTVIETFDRTDVIVPNGDLVSGTVTNWTRGNSIGRVTVPVGVAYGTDTRKVERILREVAEAHPIVSVEPKPFIYFKGFGADSLDFEIRAILTDVSYILVVQSDLNHEIAARFAEEGVEIPFAQRDIWLRNPETLVEAAAARRAPAPETGARAPREVDRSLREPDDGDSH